MTIKASTYNFQKE